MLTDDDILRWLKADPADLNELWQAADRVRRQHVGDDVHLRGLVEISNHCSRGCAYCGLRAANADLRRYRLSERQILACADQAVQLGYGTLVMQAGEDYDISAEWLAEVIRAIRGRTPLAVTLSMGERPYDELKAWREAGADRYLLRFETGDVDLFNRIHPPLGTTARSRMDILGELRELGYEVGSGVMIGIPGQTWTSLADDILRFRELDLHMIGVGPFIAHPATPLARSVPPAGPDQAINDELTTYKVVALTRLLCPDTNIPATTALASLNPQHGRMLGLQRGANVIMPNLTPMDIRAGYEIYPAKACAAEPPDQYHQTLLGQLARIGRKPGTGRGDSPHYRPLHTIE